MSDETVIVGGGLAGAAAATLLARQDHAVTVLERESGPHDKICGEFLSVEACADLTRLGLDPARLGAVPVRRLRVSSGRRGVETALPFAAQGLSRRVLDEALLELAGSAGARVRRGERVRGLAPGQVETARGSIAATRVMLATGKHDLRGHARAAPATRSGYVGFKMHFRRSPAIGDDAIELALFAGGYAGLQRVGADIVNMCLIVRSSLLTELGGTWDALFAHVLREEAVARWLADAEPVFARPLAIANLPYGYVCADEDGDDGALWRLGDQAAMTASLTGDGMAIALRSAALAARAVARGESPAHYHRALRGAVATQVRRAMWLQRACEHRALVAAGLAALALHPPMLATFARMTRLPAMA
ncbi:hypothetical protein B2G71_22540 [Novosphingobium sp. PC22D]|uniref:NAD(P)/FAD-dependent oxidoreductase n=1 Tax=Novosphingobium sp. PC22D TaxID=1962403 RepID=UPI000BFB0B1A|nr:NAD(P)-binding protein [Novosphingobium sp. PC22D]PEQ10403.1 hypothetical protein B2G71_22540 [Novosphingobium sp. PC22D]